MRSGVRCGAAWLAPAQLRRSARLSATALRVASASRVAQGVVRRTWLHQGCVARLVAAVGAEAEPPRRRGKASTTTSGDAAIERRVRNAGEGSAPDQMQAEPLDRKKRAPRVGVLNEKTADGRPKPDERTVADLVRRGWFKSEEAAVALLTRKKTNNNRYAFETAERAADWLEATLGPEPVKDGLCPAAQLVKRQPSLVYRGAATLQRKWDALTLSIDDGGVGIMLSVEQAREVIRKEPSVLQLGVDTSESAGSC